jgi:hypothetical protein
MNPNLAKRLMDLPEGRDLLAFLQSEAQKVNTLDGIDSTNLYEIAVETKARQQAHKALTEMLSPLLDASEYDTIPERDDSISTEMLQQERSQDNINK